MDNRFEIVYEQHFYQGNTKIIRDKQTGVMYLYNQQGASGGMTVLVDKDGKPVTSFKVSVK